MSSAETGTNLSCARCGTMMPIGTLACPQCQTLVHAAELQTLAAEAQAMEAAGDYPAAIQQWSSGIPMLPPGSTQSAWIAEHVRVLQAMAESAENAQQRQSRVSRLGPFAPASLPAFIITLVAFSAFYWHDFGPLFGVGFALLVLLHEMGHYVDIRRRGLPADMPVFLPGLGAYVRWRALGVSDTVRAQVSLAGPFAGLLGAIVCAVAWWMTGGAFWAALARTSAFLNLLNLIPVWVLDGGQALLAIGRTWRWFLALASLILLIVSREWLLLFVAGAFAYRALSTEQAKEPSSSTALFFALVLAGLVLILHSLPGHGMGF